MRRVATILLFWLKVMSLVFLLTSVIAFCLLLLAGKWEAVSLLDRVTYALFSGIANGIVLGTIIAAFMGWKTWRVIQSNKKKLARKTKAEQS